MKVRIVSPSPPPNAFERFAVQIDIEDQDQLIALTMAASRMGNGHGNRLYDLLERKCAERGVIVG